MPNPTDIQILKNALQRERKARKVAEQFLEAKSAELYEKNQELIRLNENLANEVESRTREVEKLAFITASSPNPIFIIDENGHISLVNDAGSLIAPTKSLSDETRNELDKLKKHAIDALRENRVKTHVFRYDSRFYSVLFSPIRDRQYVVAYAQDVTSSVEHEKELEASEAKYRGILENLNLGILETNHDNRIVKAYPAFCRTTGFSRQELANKPIHGFLFYGQQENSNNPAVKEARLLKKNGDVLWVVASKAPITRSSKSSGNIYVLLDISEQKNTLLKLEIAIKEAKEAQKTEKYFVEQISHEIRTPINGLLGMAHILKDQYPSSTIVDQLLISGTYLNKLIGQVLDLSQIEGEKVTKEKEPFTTREISNLVSTSFNEFSRTSAHSLRIVLNDTTASRYIGDKKGISQISHNLVSNAIKYGNGEVLLEWSNGTIGGKNALIASVSDNGPGISPENQDLIFQKYQRLQATKHKDGLGLGLHVSNAIAEAMGGDLSLVSSDGEGSTFQLSVPVEIITQEATQVKKINLASFKGKHCVIAEDNAINFEYLNYYLEKAEITTTHFLTGIALIESIDALEKTDVFILDYKMPGMNGLELASKIQKVYPSIPIVLLTANAIPKQLQDAKEAGIKEVLFKPISPESITDLLTRLFSIDQSQQDTIWDILQKLGGHVSELKETYGNDAEYATSIISHIRTSSVSLIKELSTLEKETNPKKVRSTIHRTLPTLGLMGLMDLMEEGRRLESQTSMDIPHTDVKLWYNEFIEKLHYLEELTSK